MCLYSLARRRLAELYRRTGLDLMDAALAHDGAGEMQATNNPLLANLYRDGTTGKDSLVKQSLELGTGLVALGASAATHYPYVARRMGVELTGPDHAEVAGAVGAAAGSVRQRVMISVTQPSEGRYRVHLPGGPRDLGVMDEALASAREVAGQLAEERARKAGATSVSIEISEDIKLVPLGGGKELFIEALVQATANGAAA